jgi:hypothetical protein
VRRIASAENNFSQRSHQVNALTLIQRTLNRAQVEKNATLKRKAPHKAALFHQDTPEL